MGDPIHAPVPERMDIHAISLECRILDPPVVRTGESAFTMSKTCNRNCLRLKLFDFPSLREARHSVIGLVEPIGIEPMTSSLQS